MADVQRLWSKTNTRPPVLIGPVRALLGEEWSGMGGISEISGEKMEHDFKLFYSY